MEGFRIIQKCYSRHLYFREDFNSKTLLNFKIYCMSEVRFFHRLKPSTAPTHQPNKCIPLTGFENIKIKRIRT